MTLTGPLDESLEIEPNDTSAAANAIIPATKKIGVAKGAVAAANLDFFSFRANAGDVIVIIVDGNPERDASNTNIDFQLKATNGSTNLVAAGSSLTAPVAEGLTFVMTAAGTYFVNVYGNIATTTGTYDVMVANCTSSFCATAAHCDDGNPCTDDVCNADGSCSNPNNDLPCEDNVFCNGADTCGGGSCSVHAGDPCAGGAECNDFCNESAETCYQPAGTACGDSGDTDCSDPDTCDGAGGCAINHAPNGTACSDGEFCNGDDECLGGSCTVHDGDPCAAGPDCNNICDEGADNCFSPGGTPCGSNDNTDCTDPDTCNGAGACAPNHAPNASPCDDGTFCNGPDQCAAGACTIHDGDPCTGGAECNNVCNEGADNCFSLPGATCGSPADTDCTNPDSCNGSGTCLSNHAANGSSCSDANPCTVGDVCASGTCAGTPATVPTVNITQPAQDQTGLPSVNIPITVRWQNTSTLPVTREQVLLENCVLFDGATYGDRDGLLSDETFQITKPILCQAMSRCGYLTLDYPKAVVRVTDSCGATGNDSVIIRRRLLRSEVCP
jgi:hypothetical protein